MNRLINRIIQKKIVCKHFEIIMRLYVYIITNIIEWSDKRCGSNYEFNICVYMLK